MFGNHCDFQYTNVMVRSVTATAHVFIINRKTCLNQCTVGHDVQEQGKPDGASLIVATVTVSWARAL